MAGNGTTAGGAYIIDGVNARIQNGRLLRNAIIIHQTSVVVVAVDRWIGSGLPVIVGFARLGLKCLFQCVECVFNAPTNVIGWWVNGWSLRRISHMGGRILRHGWRVACSYGRVADLITFPLEKF